jgi:hypothetical protein
MAYRCINIVQYVLGYNRKEIIQKTGEATISFVVNFLVQTWNNQETEWLLVAKQL